ncbi:MAG TPA: hypothetical protein VFC16_06430 [Nakamurella sp.]|nr:hypothetical protein [Nakamurella sp.]
MLSPNDFDDLDVVIERLAAFETRYNQAAKPFKWKFTTTDLASTRSPPTVPPDAPSRHARIHVLFSRRSPSVMLSTTIHHPPSVVTGRGRRASRAHSARRRPVPAHLARPDIDQDATVFRPEHPARVFPVGRRFPRRTVAEIQGYLATAVPSASADRTVMPPVGARFPRRPRPLPGTVARRTTPVLTPA